MKKVSDIDWDNLQVHDKVKYKDMKGHITFLDTVEDSPMDPENMVSIDWDNGSVSYCIWHSWLDKVFYVGRKGYDGYR